MKVTWKAGIAIGALATAVLILYRGHMSASDESRPLGAPHSSEIGEVASVDVEPELSGGKSGGLAGESSGFAFREIGDVDLNRIEPLILEKYFDDGPPDAYVRHRVISIDVDVFQQQLEASLRSASEGSPMPVSVPLFPDEIAFVQVDRVRLGDFGVASANGRVENSESPLSNARFHISEGGRIKGVVKIDSKRYLIDSLVGTRYHVVLDLSGPSSVTSID